MASNLNSEFGCHHTVEIIKSEKKKRRTSLFMWDHPSYYTIAKNNKESDNNCGWLKRNPVNSYKGGTRIVN